MADDGQEDIRFEEAGAAGIITLTREAALNALTHDMLLGISSALDRWEASPNIHHVVIRATGRAFSAGGDLLDLYKQGIAGKHNYSFFQDEYRLNARLGIFPKPIVALIDGIVMGGGVGVSVHGRYRVMTENAVFSMPEVAIGFFPDVGGSHFLPRLPGHAGLYLGLTGARIRAGDARWMGIATHTVAAERIDGLTGALVESADTDMVLRRFDRADAVPAAALDRESIDRLFAADTLIGIVAAVQAARDESELAAAVAKAMSRNSPTSMAVAFREIRHGATLSLADCMRMEYRILVRMLEDTDFYEGIRAVIVDKTNDPKWQPNSLDAVTEADIDAFFKPLGAAELSDVPA